MASWGLVATVKAPEDEVLAFIAHHLALGAAEIWIFFDDPKDPAFARVSHLPRVKAIRCTDWHWAWQGGRPENIMNRQIRNARQAQKKCRLDWLGHIDVDEFLHAPRPIADILAEVPPEAPGLLMEPFEALHTPGLTDDIFTARQFRGPLHDAPPDLLAAAFGPFAALVAKGALSHTLGKSFCRIGRKDLSLRLHSVFVDGVEAHPPFHPDLRLLHFHAQDPASFRRLLPFRLKHGAYNHKAEEPLRAFLSGASHAELAAFYAETMELSPEKAELLRAKDRLIEADLGLRAKVADLLAGRFGPVRAG